MSGPLDYAVAAASVLASGAWIYFRRGRHDHPWYVGLYVALLLGHVGMGLVFFDHVLVHGGDALFYWDLPWYFDRSYADWWKYYGYGNYFMQTVNAPLVWSGLGFLGGCFLYNALSFIGIGLIYERSIALLLGTGATARWAILAACAVCISPGLHFWTGGVSKEAVLILAFGLAFYSSGRKRLGLVALGFLGLFLALHVRLVAGFLLLGPFLWMLISTPGISKPIRVIFASLAVLLFLQGGRFMWVAVHLDELSLESVMHVSSQQLGQLGAYQANSQIPLAEMGFFERMVAILLRPFPWEVWDGYSLVFAGENMLLLGVILLGGLFLFPHHRAMPCVLLVFLAMSLAMLVVYGFTLNNFGIIYRMKSIFLPFLCLPFVWVICRKLLDSSKLTG